MPAILQYEFMIRALIGGGLVGALAPAIGTFLVLRRYSLIADTLSHVALMGVAIGMATGAFPTLTAVLATVVGAAVIDQLRARGRLPGDLALAVVLYTTLAIAVVIISSARGFNVDLFGFLFGSILTLEPLDVWLLAGLTIAVGLFVTVFFTELAQTSYDEDFARVSGIPAGWVNLALAMLTGTTIALAMRVVGVLLVGALIVIPVLASQRIAPTLRGALVAAVGIGVASALAGLTWAFYADLAAGGTIVITAIGVLVVVEASAYVFGRRHQRKQ